MRKINKVNYCIGKYTRIVDFYLWGLSRVSGKYLSKLRQMLLGIQVQGE